MRKIYQKEWFGISFYDFSCPKENDLADSEFYIKFYRLFYKKYQSFYDFPVGWRQNKDYVINDINEKISVNDKILSIGSGNCYIENGLINNVASKKNITITAIEPNIFHHRWVFNKNFIFLNGFFPNVLNGKYDYDVVIISNIDYIFTDAEYLDFLISIKKTKISKIIFADVEISNNSFYSILKYKAKIFFSKLGLYRLGQLWGFSRDISEHVHLFNLANLKVLEIGRHKSGSYWFLLDNL